MSFQPIASYGFIGNLSSCALVGKNGSIDWCCLPMLDSPSIFAGILDPERGGTFSIAPKDGIRETKQAYLHNTNILRTEFACEGGTVELLDWMHMSNFAHVEEEEHRLPALYRLVRCTEGTVTLRVIFDPRLDYGRASTSIAHCDGGVMAVGGGECVRLHANAEFSISERGAIAEVRLAENKELPLMCTYGNMERADIPPPLRSLEKTTRYWTRWVTECQGGSCFAPVPWGDQVNRSTLVLKVLAGGKGIAAAATTSLPEIAGGSDNWDYRFNWVRDTSFTVQALTALGHLNDAREFLDWIVEILVTSGRRPADLTVLHPLHGKSMMQEQELPHLRGYMDSKPVRIGNRAVEQRQHDIYGEILETVYRSEHLHPGVDSKLLGVLRNIVDYVCEIWREPDHGIWELRRDPQHFVYSKIMCWVALDRGIRLAEEHGWKADTVKWKAERALIHEDVLAHGYSAKRKSFVQAYGSEVLDATALLVPVLEFLPPKHEYVQSTLQAIQRELADGPLVYRSSDHHRREGAFGFCSFWLVDALAFDGRLEEARKNFDALLAMGNHVGLYSEEIDPKNGQFLGNFPQAFTHVGLINSAVYLSRIMGKAPPEQPLMGEKHMPEQA